MKIGKIAIDLTTDVPSIAAAVGQTDPDARWYKDGVLYVQGVTNEALIAATETLNSPEAQAARLAETRLAELADIRWQHQNAGVTINGAHLRTDRESILDLRIIAERPAVKFPLSYKAASEFVTLESKEQAEQYANTQNDHVQACFDREAALAMLIADLKKDPAALAELNLEQGWPE